MHGKTSKIYHNEKGLFEGIPNPFNAVRYHSLVIDESTMPEDIEITARSDDGEIMAIEHKKYPIWGVQFHPESILTEYGHKLLENFLKMSKKEAVKENLTI
jgi:anthranilate synthase component 2